MNDSLLSWLKINHKFVKRERFIQPDLDGSYWERISVSYDTDLLVHKVDRGNSVYFLDCHYEKKNRRSKC